MRDEAHFGHGVRLLREAQAARGLWSPVAVRSADEPRTEVRFVAELRVAHEPLYFHSCELQRLYSRLFCFHLREKLLPCSRLFCFHSHEL